MNDLHVDLSIDEIEVKFRRVPLCRYGEIL